MVKEFLVFTTSGDMIVTAAKDKKTAIAQVQKELRAGESIESIDRL